LCRKINQKLQIKIVLKGKYTLKLHKNGQPVSVEIDSLVPINQSDGSFFGTSSKNKQIWVPLLEKAYSKLHGSYRSLISGECHEAFYDLTGYPADLLSVVPLQFSWLKKKFRNGGFLLTAGINSKKPGHGQYKMKRKGLLVDHAYSIIDVKDHKEKGQNPVRLVKLRNPWSRFEWKGDYSDKSKKWDKKLKKDLHLCVDENDGVFWIDFEDFQEIFDTFSYCDTRKDWKEKSSSFQFNLKNGAIEAPRFKIEVPSTVEMTYVSLHQKDERMKNSPKNYIDLSAFVMKNSDSYFGEPKCVSLVESNIERNTLSKVKLPSGTYTIVPYTSGSHFSGPRDISRSATLLIHFSADKNVSKKSKEKNTLIKPVNKISTKKLGDKNNLKLKSFKSSTGNDLKPVNKIKIGVRTTETTALSSAKDMTDNSSNKSNFDDIKITVLRPNKEVVEDAQLSSLKTLGNVTEDSDGMFAMRTVKNGGQVLLGLDNKAKDKNEIEYEINTSECDNLMPALDSWQKNSIASFKMTKDQVEKTALIGSYIRKNNEKCRFSAKVAYSLYDDDNKIIK